MAVDSARSILANTYTKFEVRRWHIFGFSINRTGDRLTFDLLTSNLVRVIDREVGITF